MFKKLLFLLVPIAIFAQINPSGIYYLKSSADSIEHLIVLPNNRFCFELMEGNLDLVAAGEWSMDADKITMNEKRDAKNSYAAFSHVSPELKGYKLFLEGRSFSYARFSILALSVNRPKESDYKLIFEQGYNGWLETYGVSMEGADTHIFIGKVVKYIGEAEDRKILYRIYEYALDKKDANIMSIAFDRDSDRKNIAFVGKVQKNKIALEGKYSAVFNKVRDLTQKDIEAISRGCVAPAYAIEKKRAPNLLEPLSVFEITMPVPKEYLFKNGHVEP